MRVPGSKVTAFPDSGFRWPLASAEELLLIFSGGRSGHAGCALYFSNQWNRVYGDFAKPTFGRDQKTIYLPGRSGVFIRRQPGTLDFQYLQVPGESLVNIAIATRRGRSGWAPRTAPRITGPARSRRTPGCGFGGRTAAGASLPVTFSGQRRFEINNDPAGFRYSWRIDAGSWSPFAEWPATSLKLPALTPARHVLEAPAWDVDGNVPVLPRRP